MDTSNRITYHVFRETLFWAILKKKNGRYQDFPKFKVQEHPMIFLL